MNGRKMLLLAVVLAALAALYFASEQSAAKKERKIELSIRRYERTQEKELLKKYSGKGGNLTLGEATGWGQIEE